MLATLETPDAFLRASILEAMARAHCRTNLTCDPDEPDSQDEPIWRLFVEEMEPLLDAAIATAASMQTLLPVLARIERIAA